MRSEVSGNPWSQSVKKKRKAMALNVARVGPTPRATTLRVLPIHNFRTSDPSRASELSPCGRSVDHTK